MTDYQKHNLKRIQYCKESTFGVSSSTGMPAYRDIPVISAEMTPGVEMLANEILQQKKDGSELMVPGRTRAGFSFGSYLYGMGTPLSASTTPPTHDLVEIIGTIMGGAVVGAGSAIVSGNSASFVVTTGQGANFKMGQGVICYNPSSSKDEMRFIRTIATDTITLDHAFTFSPNVGASIRNTATLFLAEKPSGSLQFKLKHANQESTWIAMGQQGTFTLENVLGQIPKINFALQGANWNTGSNGSLSKASYTGINTPPVAKDSEFLLIPYASGSTTTGSNHPVQSLSFSPSIPWVPVESFGGVNGIEGWERDTATMGAEVSTYFNDRTFFNARVNQTQYKAQLVIGSAAGRMVGIRCPRMQVTDTVLADAGTLGGQKLSLVALKDNNTGTSAGYEDLATSLFVIAIG